MSGEPLAPVPEALRDRMAQLSPEKRALLERRLAQRARAAEPEKPPALVRYEGEDDAPLSFQQERFWLLHRLEASPAFNDRMALRLRGPLSIAGLEADLTEIVRRHEALRTRFPQRDGVPVQEVLRPAPVRLPRVDLTALDEGDRLEQARALATAVGLRVPDLEREAPVELAILRLAPDDHLLAVSMHHIVTDGWSWGIFLKELGALSESTREGLPPALEEPPVRYGDYARWQRELLRGERFEKLVDYWKDRLAGLPAVLELPTDHPRPALQGFEGGVRKLSLAPATGEALRRLAQEHSATLFMVLLAAFQALLGRLSGTEDVVVGVPALGRDRKELEGVIGVFVNNLVLRTDLSGDPTGGELLGRVRETVLGAFGHQDLPFQRLVEALEVERNLAHAPVFQVMFDFQPALRHEAPRGGAEVSSLPLSATTTRFDLVLNLEERSNGSVGGGLQYRRDLFDAATAERFARRLVRSFEALIDAAAASSRLSSWAERSALSSAERHQVLLEWSLPGEGDTDRLEVPASVLSAAEERAEAVAVEGSGWALTYGELERRSRRLAARLIACGVEVETPVAVCVGRGADLAVSLLAVLRSGGAYVPLDPAYPRERIETVISDSGAHVLVADASAPEGLGGGEVVRLDARGAQSEAPSAEAASGVDRAVPASALAYLIYTSGSTGRPKGVAVSRGALASFLGSMARRPGLGPEDRLLAVTTVSFDIAGLELWLPLALGARVILAGAGEQGDGEVLTSWIARRRVTAMQATPATWRLLIDAGWSAPEAGRGPKALCGGEALPRELARALLARAGEVWNLYGPTETTVWSGATRVRAEEGGEAGPVAIGESIARTRLLVVDVVGRPVAAGVPGELWIGGAGVARGYRGNPAQTAERFVPDVHASEPGSRAYRTGDLVRWRRDGRLEYLGRMDHQVKLRGFRIELGEIESVLARHPAVEQAVAGVVEGATASDRRLVAWIVPRSRPDAEGLRSHLRASLPEYMVPAVFVPLESLPLTPNGKVDRKALPDPSAGGTDEPVEPRTPLEAALAEIWRRVLGLPRIGVRDDFFALGGHSLLANRVTAAIRGELGVDLPLRELFAAPTVERLASRLERESQPEASFPPLDVRTGRGPAPLSFAQSRLWFLQRLDPESGAYNVPESLRLRGELSPAVLDAAFGEVVRRHEILRTTFTSGDGRPMAVAHDVGAPPVPRIDLSRLPPAARVAAAETIASGVVRRPFDPEHWPLWRVVLLCLGRNDHAVVMVLHHLISDGWSVRLLIRELTTLYRDFAAGRPPSLPEARLQYADYAVWQHQWLAGEELARRRSWWRDRLAGAPTVLDLPTDRPRPARAGSRGARLATRLPEMSVDALRALARSRGGTLFTAVAALFGLLLGRRSGRDDLLVGTPIAHRPLPELEELAGVFVNTLVLRLQVGEAERLGDLVAAARETLFAADARHEIPFAELVEAMHLPRDLSRSPLVQVLLSLHNLPPMAAEVPGLRIEGFDLEPATAQLDLQLVLRERDDGGADGLWVYRPELFDVTTVARLARSFDHLSRALAGEPDPHLANLAEVSSAERHQVLSEWSLPGEGDTDRLEVPASVLSAAEERAEAVAVEGSGWALTYGELERRSRRLAARLIACGVEVETPVAVCVGRGADLAVSLLAVLRSGGAYVPLDPAYPRERIETVISDSGAHVLVADASAPERLGGEVVRLDARGAQSEAPSAEAASGVDRAVPASALAYLIYTSGSTGRPKGVAVSRGALASFLGSMARRPGLGPEDRLLAVTTVSFDIAGLELWLPLALGARVILAGAGEQGDGEVLTSWIARRRVTAMQATPATWRLLIDAGWSAPEAGSGPKALCGGEALPRELARALLARAGEVWNLYGPTETTVWSGATRVRAEEGGEAGPVAIGESIARTRLLVVDVVGRPVAAGVPGELWIGGAGVARGYRGNPAQTAERFVPDVHASEPGSRAYRTGDLVRWRRDGRLEYLGRMDHQVKLRGFRIELGEIESVLARHPAVEQAVAGVVEGATASDRRLVAWIVPRSRPDAEGLRSHLRASLPEYMVPAVFVPLESLPLTPNGKVDRKALPDPSAGGTDEPVEPRTPLEAALAEIWSEVLRRPRIGVRDDFFALGGHSLLAVQVTSRIRRRLDREVSVRVLFEEPTIERLAARLRSAETRPTLSIQPLGASDGDEMPLSYPQLQIWIADHMEGGGAGYHLGRVFQLDGDLDRAVLAAAWHALGRRQASLRTTYAATGGEPSQRIGREFGPPLRVVDLDGLRPEDGEREARRLQEAGRTRRFDLHRAPARAALLRLAPRRHVLHYLVHHIAFDGWSEGVLLSELTSLYRHGRDGSPAPVPELAVEYRDFAVWQREGAGADLAEADLPYWLEHLAGLQARRLPADPAAGDAEATGGRREPLVLETELVEALREIARREATTLFVVLLSLFQLLLARRTESEDPVVGAPFGGRPLAEVEPLIGNFVNTLPLRTGLAGCERFRDVLARSGRTVREAHDHAGVSYPRLVAELRARDRAGEAEFHAWFVLQNTPMPALDLPGLEVAPVVGDSLDVRHDLNLGFWEDDGALAGGIEYRRELYTRQTVRELCADYLVLAHAVAGDPEVSRAELDRRLDEAEQSRREQRYRSLRKVGMERLRERRRETTAEAGR